MQAKRREALSRMIDRAQDAANRCEARGQVRAAARWNEKVARLLAESVEVSA